MSGISTHSSTSYEEKNSLGESHIYINENDDNA